MHLIAATAMHAHPAERRRHREGVFAPTFALPVVAGDLAAREETTPPKGHRSENQAAGLPACRWATP